MSWVESNSINTSACKPATLRTILQCQMRAKRRFTHHKAMHIIVLFLGISQCLASNVTSNWYTATHVSTLMNSNFKMKKLPMSD